MKRNPTRTPEEIAIRTRRALELNFERVQKRQLRLIDQVRETNPKEFARLICQGLLGIPLDDTEIVMLKGHMDDYKGEKLGEQKYYKYIAEFGLRHLDGATVMPPPGTTFVSLASWIEFDAEVPLSNFRQVEYGTDARPFKGTVPKFYLYISHIRFVFFGDLAESLNYSAMKAAQMVFRGVPLYEREEETGVFSTVAHDTDDYVYLTQKGKRGDVTKGFELPDWANRYFFKVEHITLHDDIFFNHWDLSQDELDRRRSVLTSLCGTASDRTSDTAWPWGSHETELLKKLSSAARQWWSTYDPEDARTAPTNNEVTAWLESQGVAKRVAEVMAQILRADGLATGPRS